MVLEKLKRTEKIREKDDLWFYGPNSRWLYSKHKDLIKLYLFEGYSPQKLDSEIFNVNSKCTEGWYSASYLSKYLGIKKGLKDQLKDFSTIEEAIIQLKSEDDDDFDELINLLEEILIESNIVDNFLNNVFIGEDEGDTKDKYNTLKHLIENDKNLILQGPSGVGKTFVARNLADSIIGKRGTDFVEIIQLHEKYSYDYFVEGYIPKDGNLELDKGIFYNFCQKAIDNPNHSFFFIIDEIDRVNIREIFGELYDLIDKNKRGKEHKIKLLYSQDYFFIPENIHIIGLLNTSNRNLNSFYDFIDKFSFFDLKPGFSSINFKNYMDLPFFNKSHFKIVIEKIEELNKIIERDDSLGPGFCIGHSYFCNLEHNGNIDEELKYIIQFKIIPLLNEYWYDDKEKVEYWEKELYSCIGQII